VCGGTDWVELHIFMVVVCRWGFFLKLIHDASVSFGIRWALWWVLGRTRVYLVTLLVKGHHMVCSGLCATMTAFSTKL
jgi:hypothetical protein